MNATATGRPSRPGARPNVRAAAASAAFAPKNILIPLDFSEPSTRALAYAGKVAAAFGARVRLLHVLERPYVYDSPNPALQALDAAVSRDAEKRLAALGKTLGRGLRVTREVRIGRAQRAICEAARDHACDLIVIGTRGLTGLKHLMLGSVAENVVRHAGCSVMVIPTRRTGRRTSFDKPRRMLVPTDFSEPAERAFRYATSMAKRFRAHVHLLYVVPIRYAVGDVDMIDLATLAADEKRVGDLRLTALRTQLIAQKVAATAHLRFGRPATEIHQAGGKLGCDLIVISTHGRTGWSRALIGSTTEETVRRATSPVLVVRDRRKRAGRRPHAGRAP